MLHYLKVADGLHKLLLLRVCLVKLLKSNLFERRLNAITFIFFVAYSDTVLRYKKSIFTFMRKKLIDCIFFLLKF